jgi:hypothetical protein
MKTRPAALARQRRREEDDKSQDTPLARCEVCDLVTCQPLRSHLIHRSHTHWMAGRKGLSSLFMQCYRFWTSECPEYQREAEAARRRAV